MGGSGGDGSGDDREEDVDSEEEDPLRTLVERKAAARTAGPREDGGIKKRAKKKNKKKKSSRNAFANVSEAGGDKAAKVKTDGAASNGPASAPLGVILVDEARVIDEDLAVALRVPRYFDSEDVLLAASAGPRCHRCGEKGHIARECRGTPKLRPCHLCAEIGHDANACPNQVCFKCGARGHVLRDCRTPQPDGPAPCMRCGDPTCGSIGAGDAFRPGIGCQRAPAPSDLDRVFCIVCGRKGHLSCAPWRNPAPAAPSCFNCGESGHWGTDCVEPRPRGADVILAGPGLSYREAHAYRLRLAQEWEQQEREQAEVARSHARGHYHRGHDSEVTCYKCGGVGHMARDCGGAQQGIQCFECGAVGHTARNCPHAQGGHSGQFVSQGQYGNGYGYERDQGGQGWHQGGYENRGGGNGNWRQQQGGYQNRGGGYGGWQQHHGGYEHMGGGWQQQQGGYEHRGGGYGDWQQQQGGYENRGGGYGGHGWQKQQGGYERGQRGYGHEAPAQDWHGGRKRDRDDWRHGEGDGHGRRRHVRFE